MYNFRLALIYIKLHFLYHVFDVYSILISRLILFLNGQYSVIESKYLHYFSF